MTNIALTIQYNFYNLPLFSDVPPLYDGRQDEQDFENTPITINYFPPSRLCGFGAKPTDNLQFILNCNKVNDSKCFFMGQVSVALFFCLFSQRLFGCQL